ncbi:glutathione S-transferase [Xylariales sp. PMI_506]|nr:glutathione S-transferase [Xylariales sp. PMI_506]
MAPFGTLHTLKERVHPRVRKIFAAAAINGLELEIPAGFEPGQTNKTPEFLAKFPLGKVPALETASGFNLAESAAIAYYIAESGPRRDQLVGATPEERSLNQQWIFFNEIHFEPTLFDLAAPRLGFLPFDADKETSSDASLKRWLDHYENHLHGRSWLVNAADTGPSLADLTVGGTLFSAYFIYVDEDMRKSYPNLLKFFEGLKAIPELTELFTGPMIAIRKNGPPTAE